MRVSRRQFRSVFYPAAALAAVLILSALPQHAAPQSSQTGLVFEIDPAQSKVHCTLGAKFSIPFIEWGLKNPSNWLLKVEHAVTVELELKGTLQNPTHQ
jgi:hypothetical protein